MARLTGKAALDYIMSNPQQGYKVVNSGGVNTQALQQMQQQKQIQNQQKEQQSRFANQDKGFLGNLAWDLTSPLRLAGEGLANLAGIKSSQSGRSATGLLSDAEISGVVNKPLQTWAGETAKAGSFLVPGGTGVKGLAKAGALSQGLYSFGTGIQKDNADVSSVLGETLQGAVTGGAIGGGLGLAGKGLSKLKGLTNKVSENGLGGMISKKARDTADLAFIREAGGGIKPKGGMKVIRNFEDSFGIKTSDLSTKKAQQIIENTFNNEGKQLGNLINQNANKPVSLKEILNPLKSKLNQITLKSDKALFQNALSDFEQSVGKSGSVPLSKLNQLRAEIGAKESSIFTEMQRTGNANLKPQHEAYVGLYQSIKDQIEKELVNSGVSSDIVKGLNNKVSSALQMQEFLRTAKNTAMPKSGVSAVDAMLAGGAIVNPASAGALLAKKGLETPTTQRLISKGLQKISNIKGVNIPSLPIGLKSVTGNQALRTLGLTGATNQLLNRSSQPVTIPQGQDLSGYTSEDLLTYLGGGQQSQDMTQMQTQSVQPLTVQEALQMARNMGARKLTEQQSLAKMLLDENQAQIKASSTGTSSGGMGKVAAKDMANAQSGLQVIGDIENLMSTNPNIQIQGLIPDMLAPTEVRQYNVMKRNAMDTIARLRTGAVISPSEEKLYYSYLPEFYDDPQTVQYKLNLLKGVFSTLAGGQGGNDETNSGLVTGQ